MLKSSLLVTVLFVFLVVCSYVQSFPTGENDPVFDLYEPETIALADLPSAKRQLKEPYTNLQKMNARNMFRALINLRRYK